MGKQQTLNASCAIYIESVWGSLQFPIPQASLVGKTTKLQTETQYSCGVRSLISIIIILWLLYLSLRYTSFQHFNRFVREICHCVHPQNGLIRRPFAGTCLKPMLRHGTLTQCFLNYTLNAVPMGELFASTNAMPVGSNQAFFAKNKIYSSFFLEICYNRKALYYRLLGDNYFD